MAVAVACGGHIQCDKAVAAKQPARAVALLVQPGKRAKLSLSSLPSTMANPARPASEPVKWEKRGR